MPLSSVTITGDIADQVGSDFDARRTKVYVTTNIPDGTVIDTDGNKIRLGSGSVTLNADGTFSASVWVPGTGSNPASWQTYFHVDYPDAATRIRRTRTFGPFTVTAAGDLADLVLQQEVPPTYLSTVTAQLDTYVTEAETARTGAETARTGAEAARDEAQALVLSDLGTTDGQTRALIENPASQTAAALSASIDGRVPTAGAEFFTPLRVGSGGTWLFLCDSHGSVGPDGTATRYTFPKQSQHYAGSAYASLSSVLASYPGQRMDELLANLPALLAANPNLTGIVVEGGANDANQGYTPDFVAAQLDSILRLSRAEGLAMIVVGTPPKPAAVNDASKRNLVDSYNFAYRRVAAKHGAEFVDIYSYLATTAGDLDAAYVGLSDHINSAGHRVIAKLVAEAILRTYPALVPPARVKRPISLATNGFMTGGSGATLPTDWAEVSRTGTAPVYSTLTTDASGVLEAAGFPTASQRWAQVDVTAAANTSVTIGHSIGTPSASGTKQVSMSLWLQIEDVSGDWEAKTVLHDGLAFAAASLAAVSGGTIITPSLDYNPGVETSPGVYTIGPIQVVGTAQPGVAYRVLIALAVPNGSHYKFRVAGVEVINETDRTLTGITP